MASQEDTDDLYADLYGGGGGEGNVVDLGTNEDAGENNEQDLSGYDEVHKKETNNNVDSIENKLDDSKASAAPSGGSFIPPPSSAQFHQAETGLQIKGSFIPPPAASNQAHSQSDVRDLTPASHNDASSQPQSGSYEAQGESNGQDGGADAGGSENRSIMPHEMPEEG
nr:uncharacterized protein BN887_02969 [Melanopsichium pennsylvanicum 4]